MEDKQGILDKVTPKAVLKPLNKDALEAVPCYQLHGDFVAVFRFPFRVGRESRVKKIHGRLERVERPKMNDQEPNNDLYLIDRGTLLNISREHFQIEKKEDGYFLVDRGSACGTKIGDQAIGGRDVGGDHPLHDGDIIAVGAKGTPYLYQFIDLSDMSSED